tara:strand:- start:3723 stop:4436 length:714 start_codon:yes stop_codon:yes gene_type:complete
MNFIILSVLLTIGILFGQAGADEVKPSAHQLSDWKFGDTLFGERVTPGALEGKVVVLEYWDVKSESCLKSISQLATIDKKLRSKGVKVIGAEAYGSGKEQIAEVVKSQKVGFSITDGVKGPLSISGLPHAVVFGADGRVLFSGHPNDKAFEATVRNALAGVKKVERIVAKAASSLLVAERTWTNQEGETLVASVNRVEGERVIFKFKDGSEVPYLLSKLADDDQKVIKDSMGIGTKK